MPSAVSRQDRAESALPDCDTERRKKARFPLHLPVHYVVWQGPAALRAGTATTCDLSTDGLSFDASDELPVGAYLSIVVDWPLRNYGLYPVELFARGIVLRSSAGKTAVVMSFRELRVITVRRNRPHRDLLAVD